MFLTLEACKKGYKDIDILVSLYNMLPVKWYPDDRDTIVFLLLPLSQYRRHFSIRSKLFLSLATTVFFSFFPLEISNHLLDHSGRNCVGEQTEAGNQSLAGQPC